MPKKDSIIPLSGLLPLRDIDAPGTDDKNRVGIANLGHYGESYPRSVFL